MHCILLFYTAVKQFSQFNSTVNKDKSPVHSCTLFSIVKSRVSLCNS